MTTRVLYVNHTSTIGGAELCLLDLLSELPGHVTPHAAVPLGPLATVLTRHQVPWRPIPATDVGLRASPSQLLRGAFGVLTAARAVRRLARDAGADLIHANSLRAAAISSIAAYPNGPPVVAHCHDNVAPSTIARGVERMAALRGSRILALSRDAASTLDPRIDRGRVHVIGNGVDLSRFDAGRIDRWRARAEVLPREAPTLAVVAQITAWKGQDDAVRALALVRQTVGDAQLLLVGSRKFASVGSSHDNVGFERRLKALIDELGLAGCVHLMGERADVETVLRAADVVLIPSWNEPFGRVMLEAMAVGTPVVATARGGPVDVIEHGVTGMLVPPRAPEALARAALELLLDEDRRRQVTAAALRRVERYDRARWAASVVDVYDDMLGSTLRSTT